MFGQLFIKECRQTAKSLIFWLTVLILIFDFTSQLGELEIKNEPKPGQGNYGYQTSHDPELIMRSALGKLTEEYYEGNYITYPIGFYKRVTLNEKEEQRIGEILKEAAGISGKDEAGHIMDAWYEVSDDADGDTVEIKHSGRLKVEPAAALTYEHFVELMDEADRILGGGSNYGGQYLEENAQVPMSYEDAAREYQDLIEKDRLTGGYARLFCDYMGIFLGVLPVFLAVTRGLRDRRAMMQELIYTRKCNSAVMIGSRYLSMIVMLLLPVLALSVVPLSKCVRYAGTANIAMDPLAFVKYSFGWLLPTIMVVAALGMFLTELTDTAAAVLVQGAWWFITVFTGVGSLDGGQYGWSLVPRHNTEMNWQGFHDGFVQLAANRALYAAAALLLIVLTAWIYSQKRKGRLNIRGKILANRKDKS
ncbi:MAG: ABC transporter permease [Lachnospiraceae bacterium]|nr:ABC transporter permease [Lachnospiraceae bacterium]